MKEFYRFLTLCCCLALLLLLLPSVSPAQTYYQETPRSISTSANSGGFYEFLPPGYNPAGSASYPLMIFLHGSGEVGNGSSDLWKVLDNGPPKLINAGTFPISFTVNGHTFTFIVIAPQFVHQSSISDVAAVVNYAIAHYKVDLTRVYMTGLSMGGGEVWSYVSDNFANADKMAAILVIAGSNTLGAGNASVIASANLPVFATHNLNDPTVPSSNTIQNINWINTSIPPPNPLAIDTIFNVTGHDAWTTTYDPAIALHNNLNVYQWMLQYSRGATTLPITLTGYDAYLSQDKLQVDVLWTTSTEQNNRYFILQRAPDGQSFSSLDTIPATDKAEGDQYTYTDHSPLAGDNFYRLSQVDLDGKMTVFGIRKVTVPAAGGSPSLKLSPNPTTNNLYLELTQGGQGLLEIDLSDMQGKVLKTWNVQKQGPVWTQSIDVSNLPRGNYFIRVQGTGTRSVQQFSKQ
jgi:hypothetical protein